jgi:hypothetical protein
MSASCNDLLYLHVLVYSKADELVVSMGDRQINHFRCRDIDKVSTPIFSVFSTPQPVKDFIFAQKNTVVRASRNLTNLLVFKKLNNSGRLEQLNASDATLSPIMLIASAKP